MFTYFPGEKGKEHVEPNEIRERSALLQKYVEYQSDSELQALYAIQALVTKLGHPPGNISYVYFCMFLELCVHLFCMTLSNTCYESVSLLTPYTTNIFAMLISIKPRR